MSPASSKAGLSYGFMLQRFPVEKARKTEIEIPLLQENSVNCIQHSHQAATLAGAWKPLACVLHELGREQAIFGRHHSST